MSNFTGIRGRPEVRQPLPTGARASWGAIALADEPWPGGPPQNDPSAESAEGETMPDDTEDTEGHPWVKR